MYIKLTDNQPENYSLWQLRRDNPQVSFPEKPSMEALAEFDVFPLAVLPKPDCDPRTHYLKASEIYQVDGHWQQHYSPEQLPQAQVEQTMRQERDRLLAASDWVIAKAYEVQNPVPPEWADYRQKLRDVSTQQWFPWSVIWPEAPSS